MSYTNTIIASLDDLDEDSFIVRERLPAIKRIKCNAFSLEKYMDELLKEIAPLMILNLGTNPTVSAFILQTEKLFRYILDRELEKIERIKEYVQEMAKNILQKDNLREIRRNKDKILRVLQEAFWDDLTFDDVEFMVKELAPLMKYFEPNPRKVVQVDAPDLVLSTEEFERKLKEDTELKAFIEQNQLVEKIRDGEGITAHELQQLEAQLEALRPELTIEYIQKYQKKDFIVFLREMIGLTDESDPKELIELRFDEYLIANSRYNSRQLDYLLLLKKVFVERKRIELQDLAKSPLAEEHPLDYFTMEQLTMVVQKCNDIKIC